MKILKAGNKELAESRRLRYIKFTCDMCGCVWIAGKNEYKDVGNPYEGEEYDCACPCCGETHVFSNKRVNIEDENKSI